MSLAYQFEPKDDYLSVPATGTYSLEDVKVMIVCALEATEQFNVGKILFDISGVEGDVRLMDRYEWGMCLAHAHKAHVQKGYPRVKIALYAKEPILDPGRFGEMVASNRGVDLLVTDVMEKAFLWLGVKPDSKAIE